MKKKSIKIALIGKTNSGKSTFLNAIVGEKISISNKKINTTQNLIIGILNYQNIQIIFYDTPGSNFIKNVKFSQKEFKKNIWEAIDSVDCIFYMIDVLKFNSTLIFSELKKISESKKPIVVLFNKIDLIKKNKILPYIDKLNTLNLVNSFFMMPISYFS